MITNRNVVVRDGSGLRIEFADAKDMKVHAEIVEAVCLILAKNGMTAQEFDGAQGQDFQVYLNSVALDLVDKYNLLHRQEGQITNNGLKDYARSLA